jgi:hypothetical protein
MYPYFPLVTARPCIHSVQLGSTLWLSFRKYGHSSVAVVEF